jgi:hypothetical protein
LVSRIKAVAVVLLLAGATCAAQERIDDPSCPITVAVAATDVPLQNAQHVMLWFSNRSSKKVSQVQFDVLFVGSTNRYPSSGKYSFVSEVVPGSGGLVTHPAADEAARLGAIWREIRGLEAQPTRVLFSDGSQWQASGSTCKHVFLNQNYIESMRRWNKELRLEWNRAHPGESIPSDAMAALLEQSDQR